MTVRNSLTTSSIHSDSMLFSLSSIMHQSDTNVFGTVDIFSQLKFLIVTLSGILIQSWTVDAPELTKVCFLHYFLLWESKLVVILGFVLQAIEASSFEIQKIPAICSELILNWSLVLDFLTKMAPKNDMQGVKDMVSISTFMILGFVIS